MFALTPSALNWLASYICVGDLMRRSCLVALCSAFILCGSSSCGWDQLLNHLTVGLDTDHHYPKHQYCHVDLWVWTFIVDPGNLEKIIILNFQLHHTVFINWWARRLDLNHKLGTFTLYYLSKALVWQFCALPKLIIEQVWLHFRATNDYFIVS